MGNKCKKSLSFLLSLLLIVTSMGPLSAEVRESTEEGREKSALSREEFKEKYPLSYEYLNREIETTEEGEKTFVLQFEDGRSEEMLEKLSKIEGLEVKYHYEDLFEGVSVKVNAEHISELRDMDGIKNIQENGTFVPKMVSAKEMTKIKEAFDYNEKLLQGLPEGEKAQKKLDGRGIIVAVIDSGIDIGHEAMKIDEEAKPYMKIKKSEIKQGFTEKVPHGFSYVGGGNDLMDKVVAGHGMHCAGIIAGNSESLRGVVPNAQLFSYKIFSDQYYDGKNVERMYEYGGDDSVYHAIEDAVRNGADVISMSIGHAGNGYAGDLYYEVVNRAANKGVVVVSAIGNYGSASSDNTFDHSPINELGLTNTSAMTYFSGIGKILAVGSVTNLKRESRKILIGEDEYPYATLGSLESNLDSMKKDTDSDLEFVFVGHGRSSAYKNLNVKDKIVVSLRDGARIKGSRIVEKMDLAKKKGAKGIIILNSPISYSRDSYKEYPILSYENDPAMSELVKDGKFWAISLNGNDGEKLRERIKKGEKFKVSFSEETSSVPLIEKAIVSGFSGWGPNAELELKPELVAPGENVYSAMNRDRYGFMSGTSMATPHVAGVSAMMVQKVREILKNEYFAEIGKTDTNKILLMNTAEPMKDYLSTELEVSPRRQGAGMVRADKAIMNEVFVTHNKKAAVELKEFQEGAKIFTLRMDNISDKERVFDIEPGKVLCEGVKLEKKLLLKPDKIKTKDFEDSFDQEDVKVTLPLEMEGAELISSETQVKVPANSHVELKFTLITPEIDPKSEGKFVEGYIYFRSKDESEYPSLSIPYLGFKGDWQKGRIIDKPMWEDDSVYKHSTVVAIYPSDEHSDEIKYKILGVDKAAYPTIKKDGKKVLDEEHLKEGYRVDPDKIAFSTGYWVSGAKTVSLRLIALREVKDLEVAIVDKDKKLVRIISTSQNYRKQINNLIYESDWQAKVFHQPNLLFTWDGKSYDAKKGEMKLVPSGQYYYRIRAKVKDTDEYEETFMPVRVDNKEPQSGRIGQSISQDGQGRDITFTVNDDHGLLFVGASLDKKPLEVKKVSDFEYKIENLKINELTKSRLHIEAMDYANNLMEPVEIDLNEGFMESENYEAVLKGESRLLIAKIRSEKIDTIEAFQKEHRLAVHQEDSSFSIELANDSDPIRVFAKDADGNIIGEESFPLKAVKESVPKMQDHAKGAGDYQKVKDDVSDRFRKALDYGFFNYVIITEKGVTEENGTFYYNPPGDWDVDLDESSGFEIENYRLEMTAYNILVPGHENYEPTWSRTYDLAKTLPDEPNVVVYDGTNILNMTFIDKDNGEIVFSRGVLIMLDTKKPELRLDEGNVDFDNKKIYARENQVTIKGTIRDNLDEVFLDLNGDNIVTKLKQGDFFGNTHAEFERSIAVEDGDYISFKTKDRFGNHEEIRYMIVMDTEQPQIKLLNEENLSPESTIEVEITDDKALRSDGKQIFVNGTPYRENTSLKDYGTEEKFFIEIKAIDKAGNVAELSKEVGISQTDKDFSGVSLTKNTFSKEEALKIKDFVRLPEGIEIVSVGELDLSIESEQELTLTVKNKYGLRETLRFSIYIKDKETEGPDLDAVTLKQSHFLAEELSKIENLFDLPEGVIAKLDKIDASSEGEKELIVKFISPSSGKILEKKFKITVLPELKAELKQTRLTLSQVKEIGNLVKEDDRFTYEFERVPEAKIGLQRVWIKVKDKYAHEKLLFFDIELLSDPAQAEPQTPNTGGSDSGGKTSSSSSSSSPVHEKLEESKVPQAGAKRDTDKENKASLNMFVKDIEGHWAKSFILKAMEEKLVKGYPDGSFKPDKRTLRREFVSMINRVFRYESKKFIEFEDVDRDAWYQKDLQALVDRGIIKGSGAMFMPGKELSREELASILIRYIELEYPELLHSGSGELPFEDKEEISPWAKDSLEKAFRLGLLQGSDKNRIMPKKGASRAELVKVIYNLKKVIAK